MAYWNWQQRLSNHLRADAYSAVTVRVRCFLLLCWHKTQECFHHFTTLCVLPCTTLMSSFINATQPSGICICSTVKYTIRTPYGCFPRKHWQDCSVIRVIHRLHLRIIALTQICKVLFLYLASRDIFLFCVCVYHVVLTTKEQLAHRHTHAHSQPSAVLVLSCS